MLDHTQQRAFTAKISRVKMIHNILRGKDPWEDVNNILSINRYGMYLVLEWQDEYKHEYVGLAKDVNGYFYWFEDAHGLSEEPSLYDALSDYTHTRYADFEEILMRFLKRSMRMRTEDSILHLLQLVKREIM